MEIIVEGKSESFYTPDQVRLNLNFFVKETSYDEVLALGSQNVLEFVNTVLTNQGFTKEDMKTKNFVIKKETKYNESTKTYDFVGYSYNQSATLKFDYDKSKLSTIMEEISKMSKPPFYKVDFTIKDVKSCKKDNLTKAYIDAEEQAQIIADAAEKTLKYCAKTDFKPFTAEYISTGYDSQMMERGSNRDYQMAKMSVAETINTVFTPEDVVISKTIYCLWIAE